MVELNILEPVDYLMIGHITVDHTPSGFRLGGTAVYAGLTARALGMRVGIVTAWGPDAQMLLEQHPLPAGISIAGVSADESTAFVNEETPAGRIQSLRGLAPALEYYHVPEAWRSAPIVHLGPVAQEVDPGMVRSFPAAMIGVTPQGWLREWDVNGRVTVGEWPEAAFVLERVGACVISIDDLSRDERRIDELVTSSKVLAVTEGARGMRLYWNGDVRRFPAQQVVEIDPTGAGDVFAAAFFYRLVATRDPWEAARFAALLGAASVTRPGLDGIPTAEEIEAGMVEVL